MDLQEGCSRPRGYTADEAKKLMTHIAHVDYENGDSSDDDYDDYIDHWSTLSKEKTLMLIIIININDRVSREGLLKSL